TPIKFCASYLPGVVSSKSKVLIPAWPPEISCICTRTPDTPSKGSSDEKGTVRAIMTTCTLSLLFTDAETTSCGLASFRPTSITSSQDNNNEKPRDRPTSLQYLRIA